VDACRALSDVAALGAFFVVETGVVESADPSWRPLRELYTDPQPLRDRIGHVGRVLGCDRRVAASITFQGLAARVCSAPFATVARHGVLPDLTPDALHWRPSATGPWPLWCPDPAARDPGELATLLFDDHLGPLVEAVRAQVAVSERVLWGSVASSVASAKRLVGTSAATEVAEGLLATGPLVGTGELGPPTGPDRDWSFRRRSCCLYYRVPGGGLCGDCVLDPR
jgi:hypothetical protein